MLFSKLRALCAVVPVIVLLLSACSDGFEPEPLPDDSATNGEATNGATPSPASPEDDPTPVPGVRELAVLDLSADELVDGPLSEEQYAKVSAWFDAFLQTRDQYFVGQATLDDLQAYTTDRGFLGEMAAFQTEYLQLLDQGSILATQDFASFSNLTGSQISRGAITIEDCTEQQTLSTLEVVGFRWITNRAVLRQVDGRWTMPDVEVVHDGQPWTPGYGCAPSSFEQRALAVAEELMQENLRYQRDPQAMPDGAFSIVDDPIFRVIYVDTIEQQQDEGVAVASPEEFSYQVLGLDVSASLLDWAVAVEVCSYRPEGLSLRDLSSGEVTRAPEVEDDFSLSYRLVVALEPVPDGEVGQDKVRRVEIGDFDCWQQTN